MFRFLRKYAKFIGYLIWIASIFIVLDKNHWDMIELAGNIKNALLEILSIPNKLWDLVVNFFNSLLALVTHMWQTKSWEKAFKFFIIGIVKRFVIEDIIISPLIKYYIKEFKSSSILWFKIKWREIIEATNRVKVLFYTVLFSPVLGLITYLKISVLFGMIAQKLFLNKILSFVKGYLLKFIPWIFSLIIDSSTFIAILIEYIITLQIVKIIIAIPYLGKSIIFLCTKPVEWVKYFDAILKSWILKYPHKYLTKWGIRENKRFQRWILRRGYRSIEVAEKVTNEINALRRMRKPKPWFKQRKIRLEKAILRNKLKQR